MGVRSDLFDFLVILPAADGPDERKAMVIATGYPNLGIYLDWQGANVEFFGRLLDLFGRRGQSALVKFLQGMDKAPQVSEEGKAVLAALRSRVAALDSAGWQQEFVTAAVPAVASVPPDPAMLATAVITQVLTPYYTLGKAELSKRAGSSNARLAEQCAQTLGKAFASDASARVVFDLFKKSPEGFQEALLTILRSKLVQDPALARNLADQMDAAAREPGANLEILVDVSEDIGIVRGDVIGAAIGGDVLGKINAKVYHKIDTVEEGGKVIGVTIGSL